MVSPERKRANQKVSTNHTLHCRFDCRRKLVVDFVSLVGWFCCYLGFFWFVVFWGKGL